jgi:glutamate N-acetyltransferase/amino-acid N-acetyltransferase
MITVDGDTSTNDTLMLLANGASGIELTEENYSSFVKILLEVCTKLAKDVAKDGEGATKLIEVSVFGAASLKDARILARSVAASNLFKAAMFGADANWGRALCAMGYSGAQFNPDNVNMNFAAYVTDEHGDVFDESLPVMENGTPVEFSEELAKRILSQKEIIVKIFLKDGENSATAWGCDLTYDYVKINGDYRS